MRCARRIERRGQGGVALVADGGSVLLGNATECVSVGKHRGSEGLERKCRLEVWKKCRKRRES